MFCIWPDDGSFEPTHVAEFLILITIYIVALLNGINYYIIAIHSGMAPIKVLDVTVSEIPCRFALCLILCQSLRSFVNIHTNISIFSGLFNFYFSICFVRNKAGILSEEFCDLFLSVAGINHNTGERASYIACNLSYIATENSGPVDSSVRKTQKKEPCLHLLGKVCSTGAKFCIALCIYV